MLVLFFYDQFCMLFIVTFTVTFTTTASNCVNFFFQIRTIVSYRITIHQTILTGLVYIKAQLVQEDKLLKNKTTQKILRH